MIPQPQTHGVSVEYSYDEVRQIKNELYRYALAKQETIDKEVIQEWIQSFSEMGMQQWEVIKRIRIAKCSDKYGSTDFSAFVNCNLADYTALYNKQKSKEREQLPEQKSVSYGKAIPVFNHFRDLKKPEYEILDELPPDKNSSEGYVLIRDDKSYSVFYSKENFKIKQG